MIPNFTCWVERYVVRSPQTKKLSQFVKDRLIKGLSKIVARAYRDGFKEGTAHAANCDCGECRKIKKMRPCR